MTRPFDPTKPVRTRDGRPARILCTDVQGCGGSIAALVSDGSCERGYGYLENGKNTGAAPDPRLDLINIPEKIEGYVNLNSHCGNPVVGDAHKSAWTAGGFYGSRADAEKWAGPNRIACIKISFEEGQFDD